MNTEVAGGAKRLSPLRRVVRIVLGIGLIVLLFGVILPAFIDYGLVFDAMRSLEAWQVGVLLLLATLRVLSKQRAQMQVTDRLEMCFERLPRRRLGHCCLGRSHVRR